MSVETIRHAPLVAALLLAVALPPGASARPDWEKVINDCAEDGYLDHTYSRAALRRALAKMPTDIAEYTNCEAVIHAALRRMPCAPRRGHRDPLRLYSKGVRPVSARAVRPWGPSKSRGARHTVDGRSKTSWTTKQTDIGIAVRAPKGDFEKLALVTRTPGWCVEIYSSDESAPATMSDWQLSTSGLAETRRRFNVPDAKRYLVFVGDRAGKRVRINEIQLLPR